MTFAKLQRNYRRTMSTLKNNKPFIGFWFIYILVNVTLFMTAAAKYWATNNIFVVLARGPGKFSSINPLQMVSVGIQGTTENSGPQIQGPGTFGSHFNNVN